LQPSLISRFKQGLTEKRRPQAIAVEKGGTASHLVTQAAKAFNPGAHGYETVVEHEGLQV
jgi:hypothetical protein